MKKDALKKFWHFIWHDDSLLSWIINVIVAFILIKFIIYPGLGLALGTNFPVVAVVSNSMEHNGDFFNWWNGQEDLYLKENITDIDFRQFPFVNGFNKGDIMLLFGTDPYKIKVGDVIVYHGGKSYPIIHRVINIRDTGGELYFGTKGDYNRHQIRDLNLDEKNVSSKKYIGRAVLRIPFLGYIKIWFVDIINFIGIGNLF